MLVESENEEWITYLTKLKTIAANSKCCYSNTTANNTPGLGAIGASTDCFQQPPLLAYSVSTCNIYTGVYSQKHHDLKVLLQSIIVCYSLLLTEATFA